MLISLITFVVTTALAVLSVLFAGATQVRRLRRTL
jgi:hypothetical protein